MTATDTMLQKMFAKYDLIRLQNHSANVNQDHLTFSGFFTTESEFAALATRLAANIKEFEESNAWAL